MLQILDDFSTLRPPLPHIIADAPSPKSDACITASHFLVSFALLCAGSFFISPGPLTPSRNLAWLTNHPEFTPERTIAVLPSSLEASSSDFGKAMHAIPWRLKWFIDESIFPARIPLSP